MKTPNSSAKFDGLSPVGDTTVQIREFCEYMQLKYCNTLQVLEAFDCWSLCELFVKVKHLAVNLSAAGPASSSCQQLSAVMHIFFRYLSCLFV